MTIIGPIARPTIGPLDAPLRPDGLPWEAGVGGNLLAPVSVTISGTVTIGGTLTAVVVEGVPAATLTLYRGAVSAGVITSPYTYVAADVGPSLTVVASNAAGSVTSNAIAYATSVLGAKLKTELVGGTGLTVTGSGYSAWADQSGNAADYVQATDANRPPASSINGIACPDFTGGTVQLATTALQSAQLSASAYEFWVVVNIDDLAAARRVYGESSETKGVAMRTVSGGFQAINVGSAAELTTTIAGQNNTTYHVGSRLSGGVLTCDAVSTTQTVAATNVVDLTGVSRIIPDGRVGHLLICNAALSASERADLKAYFASRYGSV